MLVNTFLSTSYTHTHTHNLDSSHAIQLNSSHSMAPFFCVSVLLCRDRNFFSVEFSCLCEILTIHQNLGQKYPSLQRPPPPILYYQTKMILWTLTIFYMCPDDSTQHTTSILTISLHQSQHIISLLLFQ